MFKDNNLIFINKMKEFVTISIAGLFLFIVVVALCVLPFMWLWNWLVPMLFIGPHISFWQAAGLVLLFKIIFSNISVKSN